MLGKDTSKNLVAVELVLNLEGHHMGMPSKDIGRNLVALELKVYTINSKTSVFGALYEDECIFVCVGICPSSKY